MPIKSYLDNGINPYFDSRWRSQRNPFDPEGVNTSSAKLNNYLGLESFNQDDEEEDSPFNPIDLNTFSRSANGPATQRYISHIQDLPNRSDYAPSKWRRLGAILAGLGSKDSYGTASSIVEEPYTRALQDWSNRGSGMKEIASLESDDAQNRLNMILKAAMSNATNGINAYKAKSLGELQGKQGRNYDSLIEDRNLRRPHDIAATDALTEERKTTPAYREALVKQGNSRVDQGWANIVLGRDRLSEDRRQFNESNSFSNPKNWAGLLSASKSRDFAPTPINAANQAGLEELATRDLYNDPDLDSDTLNDIIDPETGIITWSKVDASERPALKAKLDKYIKIRQAARYGG